MKKFTKDELEALGNKLDGLQLTKREREILSHIVDAATGGESGGFGDAQLSGVAGGTKKTFGKRLRDVNPTLPWGPGITDAPQSQYSDSPWNNSAVVKM